jgi:hypothetical protein
MVSADADADGITAKKSLFKNRLFAGYISLGLVGKNAIR